MTAESLCSELRELYHTKEAIYILMDKHDCKYTDIILLIGATPEFNRFCNRHQKYEKLTDPKPQANTHKEIDWSVMDDRVLSLQAKGLGGTEISKQLKISTCSVYRSLKRQGITTTRTYAVNPNEHATIIERRNKGDTIYRIAKDYNVQAGTIKNILVRYGTEGDINELYI